MPIAWQGTGASVHGRRPGFDGPVSSTLVGGGRLCYGNTGAIRLSMLQCPACRGIQCQSAAQFDFGYLHASTARSRDMLRTICFVQTTFEREGGQSGLRLLPLSSCQSGRTPAPAPLPLPRLLERAPLSAHSARRLVQRRASPPDTYSYPARYYHRLSLTYNLHPPPSTLPARLMYGPPAHAGHGTADLRMSPLTRV